MLQRCGALQQRPALADSRQLLLLLLLLLVLLLLLLLLGQSKLHLPDLLLKSSNCCRNCCRCWRLCRLWQQQLLLLLLL
jgi:hypothetical protein